MEKGRILDAGHKAMNTIKPFILILALFLTSCSIPRIIVLTDPLSPEEHINLGISYEEKGELDAAMREYKEALKKVPIAWLYLGNLYFKKGELDEAERAYKKAIKKTSDPRAMNNLAWLYYTLNKDLEKAEELALEAVRLEPDNKDFQDTLDKIKERRRSAF
jgi:Flp pilus assembly protein TadD